MKPLSIKKIADITGSISSVAGDVVADGISIDSRSVRPGDVFFAIKGENFDGHDYIARAFENGAVCAVAQRQIDCPSDRAVLVVDDTVAALGLLAAFVRKESDFKVVSITGSAGKTTTKNMLMTVLSSRFKCFCSPKSYNNNIGLPLTILAAPADCQIVISELGSNNPGEIKYLSDIAKPDIAVITTVCPAHIAGFGSVRAIIKEKVSIVSGLRSGGEFFINGGKNELVSYCRQKQLNFTTFGTADSCQFRAEDIVFSGESSSFTVDGVGVNLHMPGRANIENASAVWAVSKSFGFSASEFADRMATLKPVDMRLEVLRLGDLTVLNDCYNANPGSMENALETLSAMAEKAGRRAVFVFGKMGELGGAGEKFHKLLGRQIAMYGVSMVLTVRGPAELAVDSAEQELGGIIVTKVFENVGRLCNNLHKFIEPDDIVLIKASRSERFEQVVEKLKEIFKKV